jgi:hypothetical protein
MLHFFMLVLPPPFSVARFPESSTPCNSNAWFRVLNGKEWSLLEAFLALHGVCSDVDEIVIEFVKQNRLACQGVALAALLDVSALIWFTLPELRWPPPQAVAVSL